MIKAVIFDMDGLLIDSEPLWFRAHKKVFGELGVPFTAEDHRGMMGRRTPEVVAEVYREKPWKGLTQRQVSDMIEDEAAWLIKSEGTLKPGVRHTLSVCSKAGVPLAIASSSPHKIIDAVVDTLEIRGHFSHIYSARSEPYGKPHPGVFIRVAEHFKVEPHECLVFEDSPAGILAAKAAGMICVAVPEAATKNHSFTQTADVVLDSLEEFDEQLLKRLGGADV